MPQLHQQFLAAIAEERAHLVSRRGFLRGGAKLAGGGAIAFAAAGMAGSPALRATLAQAFTDDVDILNYALTLEHLEYAFYRDGLTTFRDDDFRKLFGTDNEPKGDATKEATEQAGNAKKNPVSSETGAEIRGRLGEIRDHEKAHVAAITATVTKLGGTPVEEATYDFGYNGLAEFLDVAEALENTGVAAYAGAAPFITDPMVVVAALGIHSVEARHAAYLNLRTGGSPFPDAVDKPKTRDEVLAAAGKYIVSAPATSTRTTAAAGGAAATKAPVEQATDVPATEEPTVDNTGGATPTA